MHNSALFSFVLSASTFLSYSALAACTTNPDCAELGYTKTSCASGDLIIKCPFDTAKVQCIPQTCETIGKKACGDTCIKAGGCCSNADCASGKVCDNYVCKEVICTVGDIYYSDKTCSSSYIFSKIPIGVVGSVTNGGKNGVVVALDTAYDSKSGSGISWGCEGTDLSLTNHTDQELTNIDFSGKTNTQTILNECSERPIAASYCNEYAKAGVSGWYLPAFSELYLIFNSNFNKVNEGLSKISSVNAIISGHYYWSSTENDKRNARVVASGGSAYNGYYSKRTRDYVRCVLAF